MIGRVHHVVLDCPEPSSLAAFYSAVLGLPITYESADWVVISPDDRSPGFAFQLAPDLQPPKWPDPLRPQQFHIDVMVADMDTAEAEVVALGARRLPYEESVSWRVFADPAGHPFCLVPLPDWAVQD
jgi:catechol 2,3-dioxygenase-like lactoylglutathione lyase family enzyme